MEVVVTYFKVLFQHLYGRTEEKNARVAEISIQYSVHNKQ